MKLLRTEREGVPHLGAMKDGRTVDLAVSGSPWTTILTITGAREPALMKSQKILDRARTGHAVVGII